VVEVSDTDRLMDAVSDAMVCMEETVDTSGMPDGLSIDSSATVAAAYEELGLDVAQQTGKHQLDDIRLIYSVCISFYTELTVS